MTVTLSANHEQAVKQQTLQCILEIMHLKPNLSDNSKKAPSDMSAVLPQEYI